MIRPILRVGITASSQFAHRAPAIRLLSTAPVSTSRAQPPPPPSHPPPSSIRTESSPFASPAPWRKGPKARAREARERKLASVQRPVSPRVYDPQQRRPYFVERTMSQNLSVYNERKKGGNKQQTVIKKVKGDARALLTDVMGAVNIPDGDGQVKPRTNHVVLKGHHKEQVVTWLSSVGF